MDWKLEVVVVPVTDVDRAKAFYTDKAGFNLDHDSQVSDKMRVIQLTPPGSACSIVLGKGITELFAAHTRPGPTADTTADSAAATVPDPVPGLQLVVSDIEAARAELLGRGVEVTEIQRFGSRDGDAFMFFSDPDGNSWAVQEVRGAA